MSDQQQSADSATDRTLMAEERTYAAWVRTGLAAIASGLGVAKLLPFATDGDGVLERAATAAVGGVLILIGAMAIVLGHLGYRRGSRHWSGARPRGVPGWMLGLMTLLLLVAAAGAMGIALL